MGKADEYRQLAAECIYMAQEAGDAGCRVILIDVANVLLRFADHHLDFVYETQGTRRSSAAVARLQLRPRRRGGNSCDKAEAFDPFGASGAGGSPSTRPVCLCSRIPTRGECLDQERLQFAGSARLEAMREVVPLTSQPERGIPG